MSEEGSPRQETANIDEVDKTKQTVDAESAPSVAEGAAQGGISGSGRESASSNTDSPKPVPEKKPRSVLKIVLVILAILVIAGGVVAALFCTHVLCIHDWKDATCTEPQICSICNRTQGEALGHEGRDWKVTIPSTCTAEGTQEAPCIRCGKIQTESVEMLPHTEGDWEVTHDWTVNSGGGVEAGEHVKKCTVCGKILQTETFKPNLTAQEEGACKMAASLISSGSGVSRDTAIQSLEWQQFSEAEAVLAVDHCNADWNNEAVESAKFYMQSTGASRSTMMQWLTTWQKFTEEQAEYACQEVGL